MVSTSMTGHVIEAKLGYPNQPLVDIGPGGKLELAAVARIEYPGILERTVANKYLFCDLVQLYLTFAILEIRCDDDVIKILIIPGSADFCGEAFQAAKHHGEYQSFVSQVGQSGAQARFLQFQHCPVFKSAVGMENIEMQGREEHHHASTSTKLICQFIVVQVANLESILIKVDRRIWKPPTQLPLELTYKSLYEGMGVGIIGVPVADETGVDVAHFLEYPYRFIGRK